MPLVFKLKYESVAFVIPILFSCKEVENTSDKEINHFEESNDEEKFEDGRQKDGKRDLGGIVLLYQKEAKANKNSGHSQIPWENGKTYYGIWSRWSKTREARGKKELQRIFEEEEGANHLVTQSPREILHSDAWRGAPSCTRLPLNRKTPPQERVARNPGRAGRAAW